MTEATPTKSMSGQEGHPWTGEPSALDIYFGDNAEVLPSLPAEAFDLIYIDPPFNTGRKKQRTRLRTVRDGDGDRVGFKGQRYRTTRIGSRSFADDFDDYIGFLEPRLAEARRLLKSNGLAWHGSPFAWIKTRPSRRR